MIRLPDSPWPSNLLTRHTFTSRWLFTGISSHLYYADWTIDDLLGEFTNQALDAFEHGVCDPQTPIYIFIFERIAIVDIRPQKSEKQKNIFPSSQPSLQGCRWLQAAAHLPGDQRGLGFSSKRFLDDTLYLSFLFFSRKNAEYVHDWICFFGPAKAHHLSSGFTSRRICHRCTSEDSDFPHNCVADICVQMLAYYIYIYTNCI